MARAFNKFAGRKATERLLSAAFDIFSGLQSVGIKGVVIGGGAAVFMGNNRTTKDLDINIDSSSNLVFTEVSPNEIICRPGVGTDMFKLTHKVPHTKTDVCCDLSTRKAHYMKLYLHHSVQYTSPDNLRHIVTAGPHLLLADKIATVAERRKYDKVESDCSDIAFSLEYLFANKNEDDMKMSHDLKALYTADHWSEACKRLQEYCSVRADGPQFDNLMIMAGHIEVVNNPAKPPKSTKRNSNNRPRA